jgi:type IV pilus assembly protein PilX
MNAPEFKGQRGVALIVVLILLLIVTLLGLASMHGTLLEERMAGNLYDRSLSFQASERALREAEALVRTGQTDVGQDCTGVTTACPIPDPVTSVLTGCSDCWHDATPADTGDLAAGTPQYYIQRMQQTTTADLLSQGSSAGSTNYGAPGGSTVQANFRIFARSRDPSTDADRALVVLQGNVVRK